MAKKKDYTSYCPDNEEQKPKAKAKKTATRKEKKPVAPKKPAKPKKEKKERVERKLGATGRVLQLLVEKKYTDERILEIVQKEYPDRSVKQVKVYISCQRGELNSGRRSHPDLQAGERIERLIEQNGKIIPFSERTKTEQQDKEEKPKKQKKTKKGKK